MWRCLPARLLSNSPFLSAFHSTSSSYLMFQCIYVFVGGVFERLGENVVCVFQSGRVSSGFVSSLIIHVHSRALQARLQLSFSGSSAFTVQSSSYFVVCIYTVYLQWRRNGEGSNLFALFLNAVVTTKSYCTPSFHILHYIRSNCIFSYLIVSSLSLLFSILYILSRLFSFSLFSSLILVSASLRPLSLCLSVSSAEFKEALLALLSKVTVVRAMH